MRAKESVESPVRRRFAEAMVETVGVLDSRTAATLVKALSSVPREMFVPEELEHHAYDDVPLPIGYGQWISKPSTLVRLLSLVGIRPGMTVLEIGTGSGYSSAVMAAAGARVFTVEHVGLLAQRTRKLLDSLGYQKVVINRGDGRKGWPEQAPYDAIVADVAFSSIDVDLVSQLDKDSSRLVAPLADSEGQTLMLWQVWRDGFSQYKLETSDFVVGEPFDS